MDNIQQIFYIAKKKTLRENMKCVWSVLYLGINFRRYLDI